MPFTRRLEHSIQTNFLPFVRATISNWRRNLSGISMRFEVLSSDHHLAGDQTPTQAFISWGKPRAQREVYPNFMNSCNFSKDFFLPTTINHAIKVQHTVGKVFAILASLVLDVLTFPIRLLTCIPTVISNATQEENLLQKYLIAQGVDEKILESDRVRVKLEWEKTSEFSTLHWITDDGVRHASHSHENHWKEENVNFIEVPTYEGSDHLASGMSD